jgi:formamidopyrimidine-DNA glycosylase
LHVESGAYEPEKHDHLVLFQRKRALVFTDPRQFGRVLIHRGTEPPQWWSGIGTAVTARAFTVAAMSGFLERHARLPIKAALLLQKGFPGIGNWMADEVLWRAKVAPKRLSSSLLAYETKSLWREMRFVAREAMAKIGKNFGDPPRGWLIHERWKSGGICPKHKTLLKRETVGGRTTAWCPKCQR